MSLCVRLTEHGVEPLRRDERGIVLDETTGTRLLQGPEAVSYLASRDRFEQETEVFVPADAEIDLDVGCASARLGRSAAVYLASGTQAECKVLSGEPLVITSERAPSWYEPFEPARFTEFAREQALRSDGLVQGYIRRTMLTPELLAKLGDRVEVQSDHFRFKCRPEQLEAGLTCEETAEVRQLWTRMERNRLPGRVFGSFPSHLIPDENRASLVERGLVREAQGECRWRVHDPQTLAEEEAALYRNTSYRGYDTTGLVFRAPGVSAYQRAEKTNLWSHEPSEWLLSSGTVDAPVVGLSSVASDGPLAEPVTFRELRPSETLHQHPPRGEAAMTEAYVVTGGSAALLAVHGGKPWIHLLHAGDLAVVQPGLAHCILAAAGDYEHVVVQTPSTFQYGLAFKKDEPFPRDRAELEERARRELALGTRGSVEL